MKFWTAIFFIVLALIGAGCLQPYAAEPLSDPTPTPETVELFGIIESSDTVARRLAFRVSSSSVEEISVDTNATLTMENHPDPTLSDLAAGMPAEIFGTRDPATLIVTARTIRVSSQPAIVITSPQPQATVISPLIVEGFTDLASDELLWTIKDEAGAGVTAGTSSIQPIAGAYRWFELEIFLPTLTQQDFSLELGDAVASETIALPLRLLSTDTSGFNVYFENDSLNTAFVCGAVFPVARTVAETSAIGRASLQELINGPTPEEIAAGYRSALGTEPLIRSLVISGGVATVDLDSSIDRIQGTCRRTAIAAQMSDTLGQLPLVNRVQLILDGDPNRPFLP
jgi:hypothetical protein